MATIIGMHAAKTNLSKLLERAEAGEDIVIARDGEPVARLVPLIPPVRREFGLLRGFGQIGPEFFEALPEAELQAWEGDTEPDAL